MQARENQKTSKNNESETAPAAAPLLPSEYEAVILDAASEPFLHHMAFAVPAEYLRHRMSARECTPEQVELASETVHMLAYVSQGSSITTLSIPLLSYVLQSMTGMRKSYATVVSTAAVYGYDFFMNPGDSASSYIDVSGGVSLIAGAVSGMLGRAAGRGFYHTTVRQLGFFSQRDVETDAAAAQSVCVPK